MDWDHLRYFLALARTCRLQAAATQLNVEYTTVARRIQQLEKSLGQTLFIRERQGYVLTEVGRQLLIQAERMEDACIQIEQGMKTPNQALSGAVRVGVTEGYGAFFLAHHLAKFTQIYPNLSIDLVAVPRLMNLSRREVDIVITIERPQSGSFIVTKLTDYVLQLYASNEYLAAHPQIQKLSDLAKHTFIGYIDDLLISEELNYLHELCHPDRVAFRSTSLVSQLQAVKAGAGMAILPAFMAAVEPNLVNVLPEEVRIMRTFWMIMPITLRDVARMRLTWDYIKTQTQSHQQLLMPI